MLGTSGTSTLRKQAPNGCKPHRQALPSVAMDLQSCADAFRTFLGWRDKLATHILTVTAVSTDLQTMSLDVTIRSGVKICCAEAGCHIPLLLIGDFQRLRRTLLDAKLPIGASLTVEVKWML